VNEDRPNVDIALRLATAADAAAVRAFRCAGRRPRYAATAQKLIRRCGAVLAGDVSTPAGFHCLLFEAAQELVGVSAVQAGDGACDWIVMGVANTHHGTYVSDGRSMAVAIAHETARFARGRGYTAMVAMVHRDHEKSLHIVAKMGFERLAPVDLYYDDYAVDLGQGE
jgi:hypothetical protein